ncbi:hypothetical protein J4216_00355 [Candidatus Woesearchaeota archaeon]|nr:hypothetical protein [Candidatus Woesearchaeota archaeon]
MFTIHKDLVILVGQYDPNLITPQVNSRLDDFYEMSFPSNVFDYDLCTKEIESRGHKSLSVDELRVLYASRRCNTAYNNAAENAYHLGNRVQDESGFWIYRSMVLRERNAELAVKLPGLKLSAFIAYTYAADRGIRLLSLIDDNKFDPSSLSGEVNTNTIKTGIKTFLYRANRLRYRHGIKDMEPAVQLFYDLDKMFKS